MAFTNDEARIHAHSAVLTEGSRVRFVRDAATGPRAELDRVLAGEQGRIASRTATTLWVVLDRPTGEKGQPMVRVEAPFDLVEAL